jgi:DAK2 domain fusion protein YloV
MFEAAASWIEKSAPDIDVLNVFPVPDGDCGTNMTLTMQSTIAEAKRAPDRSASVVAQSIARGALMGARGNSGVILSQIFRGLAEGLADNEFLDGKDFAIGLEKGTEFAYRALTNPTEGTILTVVREAADAAKSACDQNSDLAFVVEAAARTAQSSVANTPNLLPILKEAGVVDAGGQGLYVLLDGMLRYLKGEAQDMKHQQPRLALSGETHAGMISQSAIETEEPYGYCTEFVLEGDELDLDNIKKSLDGRGQCLIVVGNKQLAHIHIHTFDPGDILHYATSLGTIHHIKIENMDDQHQEFLEMAKSGDSAAPIATIAVVPGDGIGEVFQSLGATPIVPDGPSTAPSTQELLHVVESLPQDEVIVLPNDKDNMPTALQVPSLTSKRVAIVPTVNIPQGLAALLSLNYEADLETNVEAMKEGTSSVKALEITEAVRSSQIGGLKVKKGQAIAFVDGELSAAGRTPTHLLKKMLLDIASDESEVITIYYGNGITPEEASRVDKQLRKQHPEIQVDVVYGGQPHYQYIASVE